MKAALLTLALLGWGADVLAESSPKLLVWINGDKAYNGLQKVGNAFEKASGVKVVVEHPVDAPEKFTQAAGAGGPPQRVLRGQHRLRGGDPVAAASRIQPGPGAGGHRVVGAVELGGP